MQEWTELARKAKGGDAAAVQELLEHPSFRQRVRLIARRVFHRYPSAMRYWDVEDLEQDIYERVLTKLKEFRGEASILTWVDRIARNLYINQSQRAALGVSMLERSDWIPRKDFTIENQARRTALKQALGNLSPRQRAILQLMAEGGKLEQMAEQLYLSKSQVHRELAEARRQLMESIA